MTVKEPVLGIMFHLFAGLLVITVWRGLAELRRLDCSRAATSKGQSLAGALRAGAPEFEEHRERIVIEQPQATITAHATCNRLLELTATVRNDTGRLIKGLEMRGTVVDLQGSPVSELVAVVIPTQQTAIEPNEAIKARLLLAAALPDATSVGVRLEVTGVMRHKIRQGLRPELWLL